MSNICMEGHNEENETEGFYKVTYVYNKTTQDAQDSTLFRTNYIHKTQIVKIQHNVYTEIDHVLKNEGYCIGRNFSRSFDTIDLAHEEVFIRFTVGVDDDIGDCADDDCRHECTHARTLTGTRASIHICKTLMIVRIELA
jgi:hypothetical protein